MFIFCQLSLGLMFITESDIGLERMRNADDIFNIVLFRHNKKYIYLVERFLEWGLLATGVYVILTPFDPYQFWK